MSFPRYPAYKNSGVAWLGEVPAHWVLDRLKRSIVSCRNGIWGEESQDDENDIPCVRVADFNRQRLTVVLDAPTIRSVTEKERMGRVLNKGDLLLEKSGGGENQPVGCVVLYADEQPAVCSNFVARIQMAAGMDSSYWRYFHAAAYSIKLTTGSINQTSGIQNLDQDRYFNERVVFPPHEEQQTIAAFLDRETQKIDALVAEQEKLIALLKEKSQAVISHAVTKGLNPDVPMKDSGIEWLGEVPEHWPVKRIKHVISAIEQGWSPQCEGFPVDTQDEWGVLKVGCVNGGIFNPAENKKLPENVEPIPSLGIEQNDVLVSRANTRELVGSAAVARASYPNLMLCDKLYRLKLIAHVCLPEFLSFFLGIGKVRGQIELAATGASSSMLNIGQSTILELDIALPPVGEQTAIAAFLNRETAKVDALTAEAQRAIELLKERRSALISAAVTGKIDVRGFAPGSVGNTEQEKEFA